MQHFSTGVPRNLRVLPGASRNAETGNKWYLRPLDAFSWRLVHPKKAFAIKPHPPSLYNTPPNPLPDVQGAQNPIPLSAFGHEYLLRKEKFLATPMGSARNQDCCKGFCLKEMVDEHWSDALLSIGNTVFHRKIFQILRSRLPNSVAHCGKFSMYSN